MSKKFLQSEVDEDKKVGKEIEKFKQSSSDKVKMTFRGSRTFELHIGNTVHRFEGRVSKMLPKSILEHKDFTDNIRKNFVIGE